MPLPQVYVISITGRSGSGKSTLASRLTQIFNATGWPTTTIHLDSLYRKGLRPHMYYQPSSIDWESLKDLTTLIKVTRCPAPSHDMSYPVDVLIVEGLFPLPYPTDMSIHLDINPALAWQRRIRRGNCDPRIARPHVDACAALYCKPSAADRSCFVSSATGLESQARWAAIQVLRHLKTIHPRSSNTQQHPQQTP